MLPTGGDAEIMEQSTLNQVFSLFGKGVTQMLQQSVNQQTVIDELRAQNRSLQTQVANLTAAIDEVEDRIFVRLQNMQPTLYTREGIPIDDALDNISSKVQSLNEKIVSNAEAITKVDAELTAKVDRDEFEKANNEAQKAGDSFGDLSNTIQTIQKDIQQIKQSAQDSNDRMVQTIKFQIKSQMLNQQMNTEEQDLTDYVTKDELREKLNKLKLEIVNSVGSGDPNDVSAIVDFAVSGKGLTEEKVKEAYNLLQQRKANVDRNYNKQKKTINQEMSRLMRLAKNVVKTNGEEFDDMMVEEEEEDKEKSENNKNSQQKIEYRTVGIDTAKDIFEEEKTESREPNPRKKRRNTGITAKPPKKRGKNKKEGKDNIDDDNEDEEDYDDDESAEKKSRQKDEKGLDNLIDKMQEEQDLDIQQQQQQITAHVDEGKLIQKVLEAVMPRVESLFESLSTSNGNGIKLEKNEAKQLVSQLSLLDSLQNEMKTIRMKINMKFDRSVAETELQARITKDEFFSYLAQLFPDNDTLRRMAPHPKSKLPPLNNTRSSSSMANSNTYSSTHTNSNKSSTTTKNINNNNIANNNNNTNLNTNTNISSNTSSSTNNNVQLNTNVSSNSYSNTNANAGANSSLSNTYNASSSNNNNTPTSNNLNNTNNSNGININSSSVNYANKNGLAESQKVIYSKNSKSNNKGKMVMKPTRNSNMVALNQKFLKGADGHYYLRDTGADPNEISASLFGTDKADDADINAAFDFQPFRKVEESPKVVKNIREETPDDE